MGGIRGQEIGEGVIVGAAAKVAVEVAAEVVIEVAWVIGC